MLKNNYNSRLIGRLTHIAVFMLCGALFYLLIGCQPAPMATLAPASPLPPTPETVPTSTPLPLPTETTMPTLVPTILPSTTPTPDPVWSILFTGNPCSATASNCSPSLDSPPTNNYFIYSDGTELQLLSEIGISYNMEDTAAMADNVEVFQQSPDLKRLAYMEDDNQGHFRFWIGDVGGDSFAEVPANAEGFWPYSFYDDDPNCLAGFDEQKEEGVITTKLYKSCIGDTEPTLIDTAVFPSEYTGLTYLLSPQGDKWLVYNRGVRGGGDETASLYTKEIDDSTSLQPIFQQQGVSCSHAIHWQDNETIEFVYAICSNSKDRPIYFYVIDWEGKELTTRYELPALQEPPSESSISTNYYAPEIGDWFGDNNLFAFSISRFGDPTPAFNGLYILNLNTFGFP